MSSASAGCITRRRGGFTLVELLLVTVVVGLLALIAAPVIRSTRERAYIAAATATLRDASQHTELYYLIHDLWPETVEHLVSIGFEPAGDVRFCRFELVPATPGRATHVSMEAIHRTARTAVRTVYPLDGGVMEQVPLADSSCTNEPVSSGPAAGSDRGPERA